jgi:hypothetical protein
LTFERSVIHRKEHKIIAKQEGVSEFFIQIQITGVLISPWPDQEGNKLQRPKPAEVNNTPR